MQVQNTVSQLSQFDVNSTQLNPSQLNLQSTVSNLAKQGLKPSALVLTNKAVETEIKMLQELKSKFESEGLAGSSNSLSQISTRIHALKTLQNRAFQPLGNPELLIPLSEEGLFGGGKRTLAAPPVNVAQAAINSDRGRTILQSRDDAIAFINEQLIEAASEGPEQHRLTMDSLRNTLRRVGLLDDILENHINRVSAAFAAQVRGRR